MRKNKKTLLFLAVSLAATPVLVAQSDITAANVNKPFTDLKPSYNYYEIVHEMRDKGIINGYEDNTFRPNVTLSRQHASALVYRALKGKVERSFDEVAYSDLSNKHAYYTEMQALIQGGLLDAINGKAEPKKELSRGEMAKILVEAFDLAIPDEYNTNDYDLVDMANSEYKDYVRALYVNGVTTGFTDYTFGDGQSLTRAHYAVFMYRAMKALERIDEGGTFVPKPIPVDQSKPNENGSTDKGQGNGKDTDTDTDKTNGNDDSKTNIDSSNVGKNVTPENATSKLEWLRKNEPSLFADSSLPIYEKTFSKEKITPTVETVLNNYDVMKENDLKFVAGSKSNMVTGFIQLTKDGYKDPVGANGNVLGTFQVIKGDSIGGTFDFREDDAKKVVLDWLAYNVPSVINSIEGQINEKVRDAKTNEGNGNAFNGNLTTITVDGYEVFFGVNSAYEGFQIDIVQK